MILNLVAEGMTTSVLVALIICGVVALGFAIFGVVIRAREMGGSTKRVKKVVKTPTSTVVVEEKVYDFTHLTEEEKDLIRKHRDRK